MEEKFKNQVVVITGASSGVGRGLAHAFGTEGARVALLARNEEAMHVAAGELRLLGAESMVCPVDVADAHEVNRTADEIASQWGQIDIWINCAMTTIFSEFKDLTPEEFRRVTDVSYHGYVHGTMAALRHMRQQGRGKIVQIGSALAFRSIPLQSAYCGAKAGVRGFSDSVRTELLAEGSAIQISQMHLPAVNTPQPERQRNKLGWLSQPVPPIFSVESIAEHVLWATERMPREIFIGWPTVRAVWGHRFFPELADRFLASNGIEDQLTDIPLDPARRDILFDALPGDPGARGPFEDRERGTDWQMVLQRNALPALAVAGLVLAGLLTTFARR